MPKSIADEILDTPPTPIERAAFAIGRPFVVLGILAVDVVSAFLYPSSSVILQRLTLVIALILLFVFSRAHSKYRKRMARKIMLLRARSEKLKQ